MADPRRNAAIWYAVDGYDPKSKGVNGRRVAGASFLKGFARHGDVDEFVSLSAGPASAKHFGKAMREYGATKPMRGCLYHTSRKMAPIETLYYPAPNYAPELWRRQSLGPSAYSICGITHTTATTAVMQGLVDLRNAPQMEWDAVICTSKAVHASQKAQLDMIDSFQKERYGKVPVHPQMPVIPLGINVDEYAHNAKARQELRSKKGWGKNDIIVATLSRLTPSGKFDPFPLFMALEAAQAELGATRKLHFLACGIYPDKHSKKVFEDGAKALMPSVSFTLLDGRSAAARRGTLSGADIFTFPIDNIQETFGLAPLEAMAAGLPVVSSNWDGMRDTVTDDVGIMVPTRGLPAKHTEGDAWKYLAQQLTYPQYGTNIAALTEIDLRQFTQAFVALAKDETLRRKLGNAGLKRVNAHYDWSNIIPQYQDLWGELSRIRRHAGSTNKGYHPNPAAPAPTQLFGAYASETVPEGVARCRARPAKLTVRDMYKLRQYSSLKNSFEQVQTVQSVLETITKAGAKGIAAGNAASELNFNRLTVERCYVWLLKYGYIERC